MLCPVYNTVIALCLPLSARDCKAVHLVWLMHKNYHFVKNK